MERALIYCRRHRLYAVKRDIFALERGIDAIFNIPPVIRKGKCAVYCRKVKSGAAVSADNVNFRNVTSFAKAVSRSAAREHTFIRNLLASVNCPCNLSAVCKESVERLFAEGLFNKAAVFNKHSLYRFICFLNACIGICHTCDTAYFNALFEFMLTCARIICIAV